MCDFKVPTINSIFKNTKQQIKEDINTKDNKSDTVSDYTKKVNINSPTEAPNPVLNIEVISSGTSNKNQQPKCSYIEPKWSDSPQPDHIYSFEVIKEGVIVENILDLQNKSYWKIGKLADNDITLAHPTISRYHAILQYRPNITAYTTEQNTEQSENDNHNTESNNGIESGWYIYDLNSSHGTFLNKNRIPGQTYVRIRVGYMLKFGCSTRTFILNGPEFDEEAASELTITEIKEQRQQKLEAEQQRIIIEKQKEEENGITWGMSEDADEEIDLSINPYAATNNEEMFIQDPKKTLRGFFEREGYDLDYKVDELSPGNYICSIELPITDTNGRPIIAEVSHKGKKKECVVQCALEACRILDRHNVLRQAYHEPMKRKIVHSDSDDDEFLDRTGDVQKKKDRKLKDSQNVALSYDQLLLQERGILEEISELESKIENLYKLDKLSKSVDNDEDDLDNYMKNLSNIKKIDKTEIRKLKIKVLQLKSDHKKVQKLINIAKPVDLPSLKLFTSNAEKTTSSKPPEEKSIKSNTLTNIDRTESAPAKKIIKIEEYKSDEEEFDEIEDEITDGSNQKIKKENDLNRNSIKEIISNTDASSEVVDEIKQEYQQSQHQSSKKKISKKRRNKIRIRDIKSRKNIDVADDEDVEDIEKYSKWIPPQNQSGDGYTDLNNRFGY